ncbi:MAG TPA: hypothetical protein VK797_19650 [Tepidisphaeraceae bacterium]|nr:hypothetical protein [Tepidisphaeraceae bacterium]
MTCNHSTPLPDGTHPEADAIARSYAHHRFWAGTFDALAERLGAGGRQARVVSLARKSHGQMERYDAHLRLYHAHLPIPRERTGERMVRWLVIHSRGVGLGMWAHIAESQERRLRRAVLRGHGIDLDSR